MSNGLITRQELGQDLKEGFDKINVLTTLPTTTGVANAYSVTIAGLSDLIPGLKVNVKFHQASNGASTLNINEFGAIGIIKPGGGSPNLKSGGIYTLVHDGVNFQLQGEGGEYGTALANDVLTGKTIGTEDGIITGTMPSHGAMNITPSQVDQVIANGYHNGAGKVLKVPVPVANVLIGTTIAGAAGTMPNRGAPAQTLTTQGGQYNIPAGYYSGGSVKAQFANLIAGNIKEGVNIGGTVGNYKGSLASLLPPTGNVQYSSSVVYVSEAARIGKSIIFVFGGSSYSGGGSDNFLIAIDIASEKVISNYSNKSLTANIVKGNSWVISVLNSYSEQITIGAICI